MKKILLAIALSAATLVAQTSSFDGIKLSDDVTFTATLRSRVYVWDWFQPAAPYQNENAYSGNLLRLNFAEKTTSFDFDEEIAVPFLLGMPSNATAPAPQGALGLGSNYFSADGNHQYAAVASAKQIYTQGVAVMKEIYPAGKEGQFGYLEALLRQ